MLNHDIHNKLSDKNIRTLIAKGLAVHEYSSVAHLEQQLATVTKELHERIERAKMKQATTTIMQKYGWQEFDVSDLITDYKTDQYYPFVGTVNEYNEVFNTKKVGM